MAHEARALQPKELAELWLNSEFRGRGESLPIGSYCVNPPLSLGPPSPPRGSVRVLPRFTEGQAQDLRLDLCRVPQRLIGRYRSTFVGGAGAFSFHPKCAGRFYRTPGLTVR